MTDDLFWGGSGRNINFINRLIWLLPANFHQWFLTKTGWRLIKIIDTGSGKSLFVWAERYSHHFKI